MPTRNLLWISLYGLALALLAGLMTWAQYRFLVIDHVFEIYGLIIAIVFVGVGIWMGLKLSRPKTIIQEKTVIEHKTIIEQQIIIKEIEVPVVQKVEVDARALEQLNISDRELEVLQSLAKGLSNEEIAAQLFISLNTVKTHLSNLYFKLDVKRRTQAVEKARSLGLV